MCTGREEHRIKVEESLERLIDNKPKYVMDYYYSLSNVEYKTKRVYIYAVCAYLAYLKRRGIDINDLTNLNMQNTNMYMNHIRYVVKNGEKRIASKSQYNTARTALNRFFKFMMAMGYVNDNPMDNIQRIRGKDHVKRIYMKPDDLQEILNKLKADIDNSKGWLAIRNMAIICVLIQTGIRVTALTEINMEDVEVISDDKIVLNVTDKEDKFFRKQLSGPFARALKNWLDIRPNVDNNAVFLNRRNGRITDEMIRVIIKEYCPVINGKQVTPHKFRATYITTLYQNTKDLYWVQMQAGHASPATTEIYIVDTGNAEQKASDIMGGLGLSF